MMGHQVMGCQELSGLVLLHFQKNYSTSLEVRPVYQDSQHHLSDLVRVAICQNLYRGSRRRRLLLQYMTFLERKLEFRNLQAHLHKINPATLLGSPTKKENLENLRLLPTDSSTCDIGKHQCRRSRDQHPVSRYVSTGQYL